MGEIPWGPEMPSNVNEGGNWRRVGDAEPVPIKSSGLSEVEQSMAAENEIHNKKELSVLENILMQKGWRAQDVLESDKAIQIIEKDLPQTFRYAKLKVHLKAIADQEKRG